MPQRNKPISLKRLSVKSFAETLNQAAKKPRSFESLNKVTKLLNQYPKCVRMAIFGHIFEAYKKMQKIINMNYLYLGLNCGWNEGFLYFENEKFVNPSDFDLKNLEKLYIEPMIVEDSVNYEVIVPFITCSENLTELCITQSCSDNILDLLLKSCPNLSVLKILEGQHVTDDGFARFCGFENLEQAVTCMRSGDNRSKKPVLKLKHTFITDVNFTYIVATVMLYSFPTLEIFETNDIDLCFEEILAKLFRTIGSRRTKQTTLALKQATFEQPEELIYQIPFLELLTNVELLRLRRSGAERSDTRALSEVYLPKLKKLSLRNCHSVALLAFLEVHGNNLTHLDIRFDLYTIHSLTLHRTHLQSIIKSCPNLIALTLRANGHMAIYDDVAYSSMDEIHYCRKLRYLSLSNIMMNSEDLHVFVLMADKLEVLRVGVPMRVELAQEFFDVILKRTPYKHLQILELHESVWPTDRLHILLESFPVLRQVGSLTSFRYPEKVDEFKRMVKEKNFDLEIASVCPYYDMFTFPDS